MPGDLPLLDGPRLAPRSGTARQLVVFLHGYGADGNDLIDIGQAWRQWLPDAAFVSPNAPEPCAEAPMGRQSDGISDEWAEAYRRGIAVRPHNTPHPLSPPE